MTEHTDQSDLEDDRDDAIISDAFRWSLVLIVGLAVLGGGVVWWGGRPSPPELSAKNAPVLPARRERPQVEVPSIPFADITQHANLQFVHENGAYGEKLLPETMGGGCAFLDFDNDDDPDLLLINGCRWAWDPRRDSPQPTLALYRNDGTGRFKDVTAGSGLDVSLYGMGAAVGDIDNDGWVDVFVSALGKNRLFHNVEGTFEEITETSGVAGADDAWSTSCGFVDYDNDGLLDLFVCNYLIWTKEFDLRQNFQLIGGGRAYGRPQVFEGTFCSLYRNQGQGRFVDVSAQAGIQIRNPATGVPMGKSLGAAFCDFDRDGWMDLVVANDTVQNFLFHNQGDGTFREIGATAGVAFDVNGHARGAMGIDVAHFRNSDEIGVAIGNFANEMTALYVSSGYEMQFTDEAVATGLGPSTRLELTFGVFFFDADLDGRLDLFAANGHLEDEIHRVQSSQHYAQSPQLFWNCGSEHATEFLPVPKEKTGADFAHPLVGRGASYADVDADGDLDVLITAVGKPPRLLRNNQQLGHNWLRLKLVGRRCHRDAIGAVVEVHLPGRILRRQVSPTRSYLSQVELPLTFGLGNDRQIERLVIHWPDGSRQSMQALECNRLHEIVQNADER